MSESKGKYVAKYQYMVLGQPNFSSRELKSVTEKDAIKEAEDLFNKWRKEWNFWWTYVYHMEVIKIVAVIRK